MSFSLDDLNREITACKKCKRLSVYTRDIAEKKVRRFNDWEYWGKPVPGFGDKDARVLIIGLAPAAHGANRTGRMFTGDSSGDWLYKVLYETGFASQPESTSKNDGMILKDIYITAVARCAPPQNKPLPQEIKNCLPYLKQELQLLTNLELILCLGGLAFNQYCRVNSLKEFEFGHRKQHILNDGKTLISSYHPSRQNTNTGKLKWNDWLNVFKDVKTVLEKSQKTKSK